MLKTLRPSQAPYGTTPYGNTVDAWAPSRNTSRLGDPYRPSRPLPAPRSAGLEQSLGAFSRADRLRPAAGFGTAPRDCASDDFRSLARRIEAQRKVDGTYRPTEPARPRLTPVRPAPTAVVYEPEPSRGSRAAAARRTWIDDVRHMDDGRHTNDEGSLIRPARDRRDDQDEIARLEGVLEDVLSRLQALEQATKRPARRKSERETARPREVRTAREAATASAGGTDWDDLHRAASRNTSAHNSPRRLWR